MQKKPSELKRPLAIPEDCSELDFWFTAEGKTFGPFPAHLKANQERATRLYGLRGSTVELREREPEDAACRRIEESQRQQKLF